MGGEPRGALAETRPKGWLEAAWGRSRGGRDLGERSAQAMDGARGIQRGPSGKLANGFGMGCGVCVGGGAQEQRGTVGARNEGRVERQGIGWDMLGPPQQSTFASVRGQWMGMGAQARNNRGEHLRAGHGPTRPQVLLGRKSVKAIAHRLGSVARATGPGAN